MDFLALLAGVAIGGGLYGLTHWLLSRQQYGPFPYAGVALRRVQVKGPYVGGSIEAGPEGEPMEGAYMEGAYEAHAEGLYDGPYEGPHNGVAQYEAQYEAKRQALIERLS